MSDPLQALLRALDLTPLGDDRFEGRSVEATRKRVFGGELIAQGLVAASRTAEGRDCHSLHCNFLLPGDPAQPIEYRVRRLRDGKRFAQRQVSTWQNGREIFLLTASFTSDHKPAPGHQTEVMPKVAPPGQHKNEIEWRREFADRLPVDDRPWLLAPRAIDYRTVDPVPLFDPPPAAPAANTWMRATHRLPDDPALHRAVLAFASDMTLLDIAFQPHGRSWLDPRVEEASLDHAMWFHKPFRADEWLLFAQTSPVLHEGRALCRGSFFTAGGELVVSATQEGLTRVLA